MPIVDAVRLPDELAELDLAETNAVVIDILRATSTIVAAIASGASGVIPVGEVGHARAVSAQYPGSLLGGERSAVKIEGFDLGNSPLEYTHEAVGGRVVVLSTTNGTRAFETVRSSPGVYAGALVNRAALCRALMDAQRDVLLVCSGTDGKVSEEDCFGAGLIADTLTGWGTLTDRAAGVRKKAMNDLGRLGDPARVIGSSFHGKRLIDLGLVADIEVCGRLDSSDVVPVMNAVGMLVAAG
ncbi:MAG: 2-phosphosulfolactate phosphatase [Phycisphaerales bacterium]|nr:2-phosphosulfolactate phosphatase [Phycisphaerales bacterium]